MGPAHSGWMTIGCDPRCDHSKACHDTHIPTAIQASPKQAPRRSSHCHRVTTCSFVTPQASGSSCWLARGVATAPPTVEPHRARMAAMIIYDSRHMLVGGVAEQGAGMPLLLRWAPYETQCRMNMKQ
jgi:hypothetical protein